MLLSGTRLQLRNPPALSITVRYPPTVVDGADLRRARENAGVPLRRVAVLSGLSQCHLDEVERNEPGRPVPAEVLAA